MEASNPLHPTQRPMEPGSYRSVEAENGLLRDDQGNFYRIRCFRGDEEIKLQDPQSVASALAVKLNEARLPQLEGLIIEPHKAYYREDINVAPLPPEIAQSLQEFTKQINEIIQAVGKQLNPAASVPMPLEEAEFTAEDEGEVSVKIVEKEAPAVTGRVEEPKQEVSRWLKIPFYWRWVRKDLMSRLENSKKMSPDEKEILLKIMEIRSVLAAIQTFCNAKENLRKNASVSPEALENLSVELANTFQDVVREISLLPLYDTDETALCGYMKDSLDLGLVPYNLSKELDYAHETFGEAIKKETLIKYITSPEALEKFHQFTEVCSRASKSTATTPEQRKEVSDKLNTFLQVLSAPAKRALTSSLEGIAENVIFNPNELSNILDFISEEDYRKLKGDLSKKPYGMRLKDLVALSDFVKKVNDFPEFKAFNDDFQIFREKLLNAIGNEKPELMETIRSNPSALEAMDVPVILDPHDIQDLVNSYNALLRSFSRVEDREPFNFLTVLIFNKFPKQVQDAIQDSLFKPKPYLPEILFDPGTKEMLVKSFAKSPALLASYHRCLVTCEEKYRINQTAIEEKDFEKFSVTSPHSAQASAQIGETFFTYLMALNPTNTEIPTIRNILAEYGGLLNLQLITDPFLLSIFSENRYPPDHKIDRHVEALKGTKATINAQDPPQRFLITQGYSKRGKSPFLWEKSQWKMIEGVAGLDNEVRVWRKGVLEIGFAKTNGKVRAETAIPLDLSKLGLLSFYECANVMRFIQEFTDTAVGSNFQDASVWAQANRPDGLSDQQFISLQEIAKQFYADASVLGNQALFAALTDQEFDEPGVRIFKMGDSNKAKEVSRQFSRFTNGLDHSTDPSLPTLFATVLADEKLQQGYAKLIQTLQAKRDSDLIALRSGQWPKPLSLVNHQDAMDLLSQVKVLTGVDLSGLHRSLSFEVVQPLRIAGLLDDAKNLLGKNFLANENEIREMLLSNPFFVQIFESSLELWKTDNSKKDQGLLQFLRLRDIKPFQPLANSNIFGQTSIGELRALEQKISRVEDIKLSRFENSQIDICRALEPDITKALNAMADSDRDSLDLSFMEEILKVRRFEYLNGHVQTLQHEFAWKSLVKDGGKKLDQVLQDIRKYDGNPEAMDSTLKEWITLCKFLSAKHKLPELIKELPTTAILNDTDGTVRKQIQQIWSVAQKFSLVDPSYVKVYQDQIPVLHAEYVSKFKNIRPDSALSVEQMERAFKLVDSRFPFMISTAYSLEEKQTYAGMIRRVIYGEGAPKVEQTETLFFPLKDKIRNAFELKDPEGFLGWYARTFPNESSAPYLLNAFFKDCTERLTPIQVMTDEGPKTFSPFDPKESKAFYGQLHANYFSYLSNLTEAQLQTELEDVEKTCQKLKVPIPLSEAELRELEIINQKLVNSRPITDAESALVEKAKQMMPLSFPLSTGQFGQLIDKAAAQMIFKGRTKGEERDQILESTTFTPNELEQLQTKFPNVDREKLEALLRAKTLLMISFINQGIQGIQYFNVNPTPPIHDIRNKMFMEFPEDNVGMSGQNRKWMIGQNLDSLNFSLDYILSMSVKPKQDPVIVGKSTLSWSIPTLAPRDGTIATFVEYDNLMFAQDSLPKLRGIISVFEDSPEKRVL